MSDNNQKWQYKRVVALASDGSVVEVDGQEIELEDVQSIDLILREAGQERWELVSTQDVRFDNCPAIQYSLKRPIVESR